jgi:FKBP-type peptidyl-prolyl cis-trans isomerase
MRRSLIAAGMLLALAGAGLAACGQSMDEVDKEIDKKVAEDAAAASVNAKAGVDYLVQVGKQPGVVTLPSGLMYKVVSSPDPKGAQPAATDTVKINYEGKLVNGTVFDSSYARNEPATYPLPRLVPAWQQAVPMMHKGDTWMLYVPPALGYGERDSAEIPANSVLIFKIQLLDINPKG